MQSLIGKHIVLGLSGGIACYKAAELCRALIKEGATVQVVMTEGAEQFITPVTMQALSTRTVYTSQWDAREANNMPHINLSREADCILIAPASADFMAKLLHGRADDLLSLMCLARPREDSVQGGAKPVPLLIAPAMNREMWSHPATQRNMQQLASDGAHLLGVGSGFQACGETGDGRMLEPAELLEEVIAFFQPKLLAGKHVVVTAGPTYEAIDPRQNGLCDRTRGARSGRRSRASRWPGACGHAARCESRRREICTKYASSRYGACASRSYIHSMRSGGRLAACKHRRAKNQKRWLGANATIAVCGEPRHLGDACEI
jgi:phosphopantothenoylcysteine decarboxylase / phosphopantothenate---cysteine ligase